MYASGSNNLIATYDYVNGVEYKNNTLERISNTEGAVTKNIIGEYEYEYALRDHLGNTRATFSDANNDGVVTSADIKQINHYYPFGLNMEGNWTPSGANGEGNKYQYNGKEWNNDFGLGWNHHDWRFLDVATGRWVTVDPQSESDEQIGLSPYHFSYNNPVRFSDPDGLEGTDGGIDWGAAAKGFVEGVVVGAVATVAVTALIASGGTAAPLIGYAAAAYGAYQTGKTGYEVVSGKEAYSGRELSNSERSEKGGGLVGGFVGGGLAVKSGLTSKVSETSTPTTTPVKITTPYQRPNNATTKAQRESVQGKSCVDCGKKADKMIADHKEPLVKEYYKTGKIDKDKMHDVNSVQPQCPTCSAKQGKEMSKYSKQQKAKLDGKD